MAIPDIERFAEQQATSSSLQPRSLRPACAGQIEDEEERDWIRKERSVGYMDEAHTSVKACDTCPSQTICLAGVYHRKSWHQVT